MSPGHAITPNLDQLVQAGSEAKLPLQVRASQFVMQQSRKSCLRDGEGRHFMIVRPGDEMREFDASEHTELIRQMVQALITRPGTRGICFGENFGVARNASNPHPHLHVLLVTAPQSALPPQWLQTDSAFSQQQNSSDVRGALLALADQHARATTSIQGSAGARIIQRLFRTETGSFEVSTSAYSGVASDRELPRLVDQKK